MCGFEEQKNIGSIAYIRLNLVVGFSHNKAHMPLVQLVFMSSFIDEHGRDLVDLVGRSSLGKEGGDVKGMTLFSNGNILQLLQGEAFAVAKLFHALPLQTNQFQVISMAEGVIDAISLNRTCIGFD